MNRKQTIAWLIANSTAWDEEDKKVLNTFTDEKIVALAKAEDERLTLLANAAEDDEPDDEDEEDDDEEETTANMHGKGKKKKMPVMEEEDEEDMETNAAAKKPAKKPVKKPTAKEWLEEAPEEVQVVVRNAIRIDNEEKTGLIAKIVANTNNPYSKEQLATMTTEQLRPLAKLATPAVHNGNGENRVRGLFAPNFVGSAAPTGNQAEDEEEGLPLPTINWSEEKSKK